MPPKSQGGLGIFSTITPMPLPNSRKHSCPALLMADGAAWPVCGTTLAKARPNGSPSSELLEKLRKRRTSKKRGNDVAVLHTADGCGPLAPSPAGNDRSAIGFRDRGHHGGLPDKERLRERLKLPEETERYSRAITTHILTVEMK